MYNTSFDQSKMRKWAQRFSDFLEFIYLLIFFHLYSKVTRLTDFKRKFIFIKGEKLGRDKLGGWD